MLRAAQSLSWREKWGEEREAAAPPLHQETGGQQLVFIQLPRAVSQHLSY